MSNIEYKSSGAQIAKNSIFLYLRQILILVVGLITVRVTLRALGVEDYGVYNVVAGSVTLFSFLVGAVGMGAQRYFSFYIGQGDKEELSKVFTLTLTIYMVLSALVLLMAETIGIYLLENKLIIPIERMNAARIVFQFACISLCFNIMQAPFMAAVVAHENMKVFAQLGVYDALARLLLVLLLTILPFDKLVLYGFLYMTVSASCTFFYYIYTNRHYQECVFRLSWDKNKTIEILKYNGWNLWGQLVGVVKGQGIAIMLNTFFGPIINAALQVANQVRGMCVSLSQNFMAAVNPQIIKSYSANDLDRMFQLSFCSAKLNFILMLVLILPMTFHVEYLLELWINEVPEYTVLICRLLLFDSLVEVASTPFATINQATGKIGLYQFVIGIVGFLNIPFAYLALRFYSDPIWVFAIGIFLQCVIAFVRVIFIRRVKKGLIQAVLLRVFAPCAFLLALSFLLSLYFVAPAENFKSLCFYSLIQVSGVMILSYLITLNKYEKSLIFSVIKHKKLPIK